VLAERRAQRAEQAEQSAARRAADAQVLAASLARERARLEAERDAARAEAAAAREGADAAIAEAGHLKSERDELRDALERARVELAQAASEPAPAVAPPAAPAPGGNGNGRHDATAPPVAWPAALRRELTVARTAAAVTARSSPSPAGPASVPVPGLARERQLVERRTGGARAAGPMESGQTRRGDRAAPVTALALERERSSRLQAQLDRSVAVEQELRAQLAALERAIAERIDAERRIEAALRRVREELTAANAFAAATQDAPRQDEPTPSEPVATEAAAPAVDAEPDAPTPQPTAADSPAPQPEATEPPVSTAPAPVVQVPPALAPARPAPSPQPIGGLDPRRLAAARERLRAKAPVLEPLAEGPVAPWLTRALQRLTQTDPDLAGRLTVALLPAHGLPAERPLRYDLVLDGRGCMAVDVAPGEAIVERRPAPRPSSAVDLRVTADHAGLARLLHGKRTWRRPAKVRGRRRALRELRALAQAPYGIRDLATAGVALDAAVALQLVALAIDPAGTEGERFAIGHAPLAGGPIDAWLKISDGEPPVVCDRVPAEPVRLTLRCTRGALLPLVAGIDPPAGEVGTLDGDTQALALLRSWIAQTEQPPA